MAKHYILCDDYSEFKELSNDNDLKELLIEEIESDTFVNFEENVVKSNFKVLKKLALGDYNIKYIIEQLEGFGWYVLDLCDLQENLSTYQAYKHGTGIPASCMPKDCIEETLNMINEEIK